MNKYLIAIIIIHSLIVTFSFAKYLSMLLKVRSLINQDLKDIRWSSLMFKNHAILRSSLIHFLITLAGECLTFGLLWMAGVFD
jgi:hypothetical protein